MTGKKLGITEIEKILEEVLSKCDNQHMGLVQGVKLSFQAIEAAVKPNDKKAKK